ncbi:MAG: hypothetical protein GY716_16035 [bacterium]|nr:hypothetical protein [bacterium]
MTDPLEQFVNDPDGTIVSGRGVRKRCATCALPADSLARVDESARSFKAGLDSGVHRASWARLHRVLCGEPVQYPLSYDAFRNHVTYCLEIEF